MFVLMFVLRRWKTNLPEVFACYKYKESYKSRLNIRDQLAKVKGVDEWDPEYIEEQIALMPACEDAVMKGLVAGGIGAGTLTEDIMDELGVFKDANQEEEEARPNPPKPKHKRPLRNMRAMILDGEILSKRLQLLAEVKEADENAKAEAKEIAEKKRRAIKAWPKPRYKTELAQKSSYKPSSPKNDDVFCAIHTKWSYYGLKDFLPNDCPNCWKGCDTCDSFWTCPLCLHVMKQHEGVCVEEEE